MDALQAWVAETLEHQASWRRSKAEEYHEDARNLASATALERAAKYVRDLESPDKSPNLRALIALKNALEVGGRYATDPEAIVSAGRRVSRFGFDRQASIGFGRQASTNYEDAVNRLFEDSAESWAESLGGDSMNQPPASIVEYFDSIGFPIFLLDEDEG